MNPMTTTLLASEVQGTLIGDDRIILGNFNFLQKAGAGDVVIRHWIDKTGVKMAAEKDVSCIITQNPRDDAVKLARKVDLPLIITPRIELANALAIKWSIEKFAPETIRVVVTGTNGKSTTSHMIYSILQNSGLHSYTNTDALSEFNTLIDPMVATQIADLSREIEVMVLEISEVQGWEDRIMENHAYLMTRAINPDMLVLTNVALDHIGLVNSLEEAYQEISGALIDFEGDTVVLNGDDPLIMKMKDSVPSGVRVVLFGQNGLVESKDEGIFLDGEILIAKEDLPFQGPHFIQNTAAAIAATFTLGVGKEPIKQAVINYKPLKRRFNILQNEPLIIDDFAHNPDGIRATIKSASQLSSGKLHLVCAIRGSRGEPINRENAKAVAKSMKNLKYTLILSSSQDVVDQNNLVKPLEKKVFIDELQKEGLIYTHCKNLKDALKEAMKRAGKKDIILLIGAQGMDPASEVLNMI